MDEATTSSIHLNYSPAQDRSATYTAAWMFLLVIGSSWCALGVTGLIIAAISKPPVGITPAIPATIVCVITGILHFLGARGVRRRSRMADALAAVLVTLEFAACSALFCGGLWFDLRNSLVDKDFYFALGYVICALIAMVFGITAFLLFVGLRRPRT